MDFGHLHCHYYSLWNDSLAYRLLPHHAVCDGLLGILGHSVHRSSHCLRTSKSPNHQQALQGSQTEKCIHCCAHFAVVFDWGHPRYNGHHQHLRCEHAEILADPVCDYWANGTPITLYSVWHGEEQVWLQGWAPASGRRKPLHVCASEQDESIAATGSLEAQRRERQVQLYGQCLDIQSNHRPAEQGARKQRVCPWRDGSTEHHEHWAENWLCIL